jgi:hypothetical protein
MSRALRRLPGLVGSRAGVAAVGLLWRPSGHPVSVVTSRGKSTQLAGDGLYRYDTVFTAEGNRAVDADVLAPGMPVLVTAWRRFRGPGLAQRAELRDLESRRAAPRGDLGQMGSRLR